MTPTPRWFERSRQGERTAQIVMRALEQKRSALDPKTIEYNVYKLYS